MAGLTAGVILVDPSGALIGANAAALRMHGVEKRLRISARPRTTIASASACATAITTA